MSCSIYPMCLLLNVVELALSDNLPSGQWSCQKFPDNWTLRRRKKMGIGLFKKLFVFLWNIDDFIRRGYIETDSAVLASSQTFLRIKLFWFWDKSNLISHFSNVLFGKPWTGCFRKEGDRKIDTKENYWIFLEKYLLYIYSRRKRTEGLKDGYTVV